MKNLTAKMSSFVRAFHSMTEGTKVFSDDISVMLLGREYDEVCLSLRQGSGFFLPGYTGSEEDAVQKIAGQILGGSVLGRSAFCEVALENEILLGCRQYVLFASGYDTWSIRKKDYGLSVYELDLPEVIEDKKTRIRDAGLDSCAVYVPCDLSDCGWVEHLKKTGFRAGAKTFGSLLGLSYYLEKEQFRELMHHISRIWSKGSALCMDYPMEQNTSGQRVTGMLASAAGEPMKASYTYCELEQMLDACGFLIYEHLDAREMTERFFAPYNMQNPNRMIQAPESVGYLLAVKKEHR